LKAKKRERNARTFALTLFVIGSKLFDFDCRVSSDTENIKLLWLKISKVTLFILL